MTFETLSVETDILDFTALDDPYLFQLTTYSSIESCYSYVNESANNQFIAFIRYFLFASSSFSCCALSSASFCGVSFCRNPVWYQFYLGK